jgi:hypothetical protein
MAITLRDMLQPQVILDVTSRIRQGQGRLGKWFGFHYTGFTPSRGALTGPNTKEVPTRHGTYRIFDRTRTVAKGRAPGTGPATTQFNPVGEVNYTCARFHEKARLDAEEMGNLSPIMGPNSQVDPGGQNYISEQETYLVERFNNAIELMTAGMIRGKWYLQQVGEDFIPVLTQPGSGGYITINHQVPAGNQGTLDMLGEGAIIDVKWDQSNAKIISKHLPGISRAMARQHGYPLEDIWVDPITWGYVITNTEVVNTAGSAMTPFTEFQYVNELGSDAEKQMEWVAVLRGYPTVRWHILPEVIVGDGGTDPSYASGTGTLTQVIPEKYALFLPRITKDWVDLLHCPEYVSDAPGMPAVRRVGFYFWHEWITQPTAVELIGLMNCVPRLRVPKAIALGQVLT